MTAVVQTCEPGHDVDELMAQMTEHRIRHVPVMDDGQLVAVVSIGDVVKSRITPAGVRARPARLLRASDLSARTIS